ncbi:hypothetical protein [Compostimonas suwonensis]|uniref:Uncharacterized protein n=1 Tax=Compostimonas suwonensis TaxID=1048394 RepID=A0A2M9BZS6_9MICO|nr:hypothetical protein [Compostimonas suwonensis]PJJ63595.1 hypothetical protein CLV54_1265 [Compostimonas suwonensis]
MSDPAAHGTHPRGSGEADRARKLRELADDLSASRGAAADPESIAADWLTRPGVLRRLAGLLATGISPETDRVVAIGAGAAVLGCAVSLASGLPFVAIAHDGPSAADDGPSLTVFGRVRPSETIAILSLFDEAYDDVRSHLVESDVVVSGRQVVLVPHSTANARGAHDPGSLFALDDAQHITPRKEET